MATRTFQALRIAVNHELEQLERALDRAARDAQDGRGGGDHLLPLARGPAVKHAFRDSEQLEPLTKKPVTASDEEDERESRAARSAKLRAARRAARTASDAKAVTAGHDSSPGA